ncbi:hypothetical protein QEH59_17945 [Coraliomargarita sp. SDUM461004]|uniref:Uncharacterized protein n=1 Tax=Thalassobacterium sedimentorum TaxID=3041258 RepID=A0ABU1AQ11_9BACT|nr:hypothetical protein [Coraliomargarita sp. SDUM461004]MDQ8196323.1 hypothetical protein [Coraliomargarita sp. SDUM461004]
MEVSANFLYYAGGAYLFVSALYVYSSLSRKRIKEQIDNTEDYKASELEIKWLEGSATIREKLRFIATVSFVPLKSFSFWLVSAVVGFILWTVAVVIS